MLSITLHEKSPAGDHLSQVRVEHNTVILNNFMLTLRKVSYDQAGKTSYWYYSLRGICDGPALEAWAIGLPDPAAVSDVSHDYMVIGRKGTFGFAGIQFTHTIEPGQSSDFMLAVSTRPEAALVPVAVQVGGVVFSGWLSGPRPEQAEHKVDTAPAEVTAETPAGTVEVDGIGDETDETGRCGLSNDSITNHSITKTMETDGVSGEEKAKETGGTPGGVKEKDANGVTDEARLMIAGTTTIMEKMNRLLRDMESVCAVREAALEGLIEQLTAIVNTGGKILPVGDTARNADLGSRTASRHTVCTHQHCPYYGRCQAVFRG